MGKYRGKEQLCGASIESICSDDMHEDSPSSPSPEKQRMRPWLESLLDSGETNGISWLNKDEGTFKVSWKHGSRSGYNVEKDASVFELWAKHTGRYCPENESPNPKRWKANFRCALNSLSDVAPVKTKGKSKGNDAFRVFQFMEKIEKKKRKTNKETKQRLRSSSDDEIHMPSRKRRCLRSSRARTTEEVKQNCEDIPETETTQSVLGAAHTITTINVISSDESRKEDSATSEIKDFDPETRTTTCCNRKHGCGYSVTVKPQQSDAMITEVMPQYETLYTEEVSSQTVDDYESCTSSSSTAGSPMCQEEIQPVLQISTLPKPVIDLLNSISSFQDSNGHRLTL